MEEVLGVEFYKALFEYSLDAIFLTTTDGHVHRANDAACKMLQRSEPEIICGGREIVADLNDPRVIQAMEYRRRYGFVKAHINFKKKDGTIFPVSITSRVFKDSNGKEWNVMIARDISVIKKAEEVLIQKKKVAEYLADNDYLTDVLNRRGFMKKLRITERNSRRSHHIFSLVLIDIDNLKKINDLYGHLRGDKILRRFADLVTKKIKPHHYFGRVGGDEFILCMPNTSLVEAIEFTEKLKNSTHEIKIKNKKGNMQVTASFGVVSSNGKEATNLSTLIARADEYMYEAKKTKDAVYGR